MSAHDDLRGGRVIDITEDRQLDTYCVKLMDIMGDKAVRSAEHFETAVIIILGACDTGNIL